MNSARANQIQSQANRAVLAKMNGSELYALLVTKISARLNMTSEEVERRIELLAQGYMN